MTTDNTPLLTHPIIAAEAQTLRAIAAQPAWFTDDAQLVRVDHAIVAIERVAMHFLAPSMSCSELPDDVAERCQAMTSANLLDHALQVFVRAMANGKSSDATAAQAYRTELLNRLDARRVYVIVEGEKTGEHVMRAARSENRATAIASKYNAHLTGDGPYLVHAVDLDVDAFKAAPPHLHPSPAVQGDALVNSLVQVMNAQYDGIGYLPADVLGVLNMAVEALAARQPVECETVAEVKAKLSPREWSILLTGVGDAFAVSQPVDDQHPDDLAVGAFAAAMKAKMASARAKGRGGWQDPAQCSADDLSRMLRDHLVKGDPIDVANFCMMLHQRGEPIMSPAVLIPDNEIVRNILGRPNFACLQLAGLLRDHGHSIPHKAESEQAAVLLFMLNCYLELPDRWYDNMQEKLRRMKTAANGDACSQAAASNQSPGDSGQLVGQEPMFYIQDTRQFVGNCPTWWGPNGSGYVTRLDEAGRYTEQQAVRHNRTRQTDIPWPCSEIDALARLTVDVQHMRDRADRLAELALIDGQAGVSRG